MITVYVTTLCGITVGLTAVYMTVVFLNAVTINTFNLAAKSSMDETGSLRPQLSKLLKTCL